jgi:hypothetical protein
MQDRPVRLGHDLVDLSFDHVDRGPHQLDGLVERDAAGELPWC